jgi:hypothetical protein
MRKKGPVVVVWIVAVVMTAVAAGLAYMVLTTRQYAAPEALTTAPAVARKEKPAKATVSRKAFGDAVYGKSPKLVLRDLGKPDMTEERNGLVYWHYYDKTVDEVTGTTDPDTVVHFLNGSAYRIDFNYSR